MCENSIYRQQQVFTQHTLYDIFRWTHHVEVFVAFLYLGKHYLVDIERLVNDVNIFARLLFIVFLEVF